MKKKVILDVDTGTDDAIAIMMAALSPELELLGVCSVGGNRALSYTTENTLRVLEYINCPVTAYRGCEWPMVASLPKWRRPMLPFTSEHEEAKNVHSDYLDMPAATRKVGDKHAVTWLVDTIMASDGDITLIPVGPQTNIGMALRMEPRIAEKLEQIVFMGGAHAVGNTTPTSEFNIWMDPEAAKIVADSGAKITVVPVNATHAAYVTLEECDEIEALGTPAAIKAAEMIRQRIYGYMEWQPLDVPNAAPVHDPLAVCAVLNPQVLKDVRHVFFDVDFSGGASDGQTIFDVCERYKHEQKNAYVALDADRELFVRMLKETLALKID